MLLYLLINNKTILILSMLAAALFRTRLLEKLEKAKEAKRRRLEATSTATLPLRLESLQFLSS